MGGSKIASVRKGLVMNSKEACTIRQTSDVGTIRKVIEAISDVKNNLEKRVSFSEYAIKLATYADNFVLYEGGNAQAFASMYANDFVGKTAFITLISCTQTSRGKGYGSIMLEYLKQSAVDKGMTTLRLEVDHDNAGAIRFYQRYGLTTIGTTPHGYLMEIKL